MKIGGLWRRMFGSKKATPGSLGRRSIEVRLGVDLGTSATKVMYARKTGVSTVIPVLWPDPDGQEVFWIPSTVGIDCDGRLAFGHAVDAHGGHAVLSHFKMLLADAAEPGRFAGMDAWDRWHDALSKAGGERDVVSPIAVAATYLYWIVRESVRYIERREGSPVARVDVNVCVPFQHSEDAAANEAFLATLAAAEALHDVAASGDEGLPDGHDLLALAAEKALTSSWSEQQSRWQPVPEALAAFVSIVENEAWRDGVYALYDIGEGTTDVTVMEHSPIGAGFARQLYPGSRSVPKAVAWCTRELKRRSADGMSPRHAEAQVFDEWKLATDGVWRDAYATFRRQTAWTGERVRVFVSGGGSYDDRFVSRVGNAWIPNFGTYRVERLPAPNEYAWETEAPFARMCVAYGLTHDVPTLVELVPPREVGDRTPERTEVREEEDQLHPYG